LLVVGHREARVRKKLRYRCMSLGATLLVTMLAADEAAAQPTSIFEAPDRAWVINGFRVPAIADTFALMEVNRYQVVELGFSLVYSGPLQRDLDMTIYVYPPRVDGEDFLRAELAAAVDEMQRYAASRRNPWTMSIKTEGAYSQPLSSGETLEGLMAEAEYFRAGQTSRTFAYVFERDGHILKYRITYDSGAREDLWEFLDRWMIETASTIREVVPG